MIFGILLWITLSIPLQTSPEFVVREIRACCHHRITFKCENFKIAIIQARYIANGQQEKESVAAVIHSTVSGPTSSSISSFSPSGDDDDDDDKASDFDYYQDHQHHRFIPPSQPSVSLWDLDLKFAHELQKENLEPPFPINTLPEWHPDHSSHAANRRRFSYPRATITIPPKFPKGSNYTKGKVLEMPLYETNFLDSDTIWNQPLFPLVSQSETSSSSLLFSSKYFSTPHSTREGAAQTKTLGNKCLSYQTLMNAAHHATGSSVLQTKTHSRSSLNRKDDGEKPAWHFKDLRTYFNRRCSGKSECDVLMLQNKEGQDEELSGLCQLMPDGEIVVKYICFNASIESSKHSKCNKDVTSATEGFVMSPGYPEVYPGDQPCHIRLHVPQQKILLIFFDISLRAQDKKKCRDTLTVTDSHQFKLISTCGDQGSAIAILSETHELNITLNPESRLAFPKRGFLAYYRVIGCVDPILPQNSYLAFRNATRANVICDVGHIFPDSLSRSRWLYCSPLDHRWLGNFPFCNDIRNLVERNSSIEQMLRNDPSVWPLKHPRSDEIYFTDVGLPVIVLMSIFAIHGVILYLIWRQRSRLEELENQTNQEMERLCSTNNGVVDEGGSIFSFTFPDSFAEDIWDHDYELECDETDQDPGTLTTTTLTLQTDTTPNSSSARKIITDFSCSEERNGHFRFYQQHGGTASSSTITSSHNNSSSITRSGHHSSVNSSSATTNRPHIGYVGGQLLPVSFNGYFRQTAV